MRVEHEYDRGGALAYLAAWDVGRGRVFGRCEDTTGIDPFGALVDQVMSQEPYASAQRVFWIVDSSPGSPPPKTSPTCSPASTSPSTPSPHGQPDPSRNYGADH